MMLPGLFVTVFLVALVGTYVIRSYALKHLLDIPNQRSSHQTPVPRGGGLSVVAAFALFMYGLYLLDWANSKQLLILSTGLLVAGIGFWDDHRPIAARWRFLVHALAALAALLLLPGMPEILFGTQTINLGLTGYALGLVFLIWSLNLFNFMDGIDGIAASEALFVATALAGLIFPLDSRLAMMAAGLGVCSLGFLIWNWPPAKIFMGDVGSGFIGFTLGLLILSMAHLDSNFLYIGLILFAVFIVDASYTLGYRFIDGQQWYAAHCSHAYQQAAKRYGHRRILISVWAINLFWLLPLAFMAYRIPQSSGLLLAIAYLPLLIIAIVFSAGKRQTP